MTRIETTFSNSISFRRILGFLLLLLTAVPAFSESAEGEEYNAGETIMHHISDSHEWHLWTITGEGQIKDHWTIPLPVILYHKGEGLKMFMSSKFEHGHVTHQGYANDHEKIVYLNADGTVNDAETANIIDLSITKNVVTIFITAALLLFVFIGIARSYKRNPNTAPKGMQSFFEPVIVFIRDEVAVPIIGKDKYRKFMPFLLSVFFFIWFGNLLGLIPFFPGGANMTGNIAVTAVLATIVLILIWANSNKNYWEHVFKMPGVPLGLLLIITPLEILGMFLKPIILALRLFANIMAGHITILAFMSLIFILGKSGEAAGVGYGAGVVSVVFSLIVSVLELLVALLQAFIFTMLTAVFLAGAMEESHH